MKLYFLFLFALMSCFVFAKTEVQGQDLLEQKMQEAFRSKSQSFVKAAGKVLALDPNHLKALNYLSLYYLNRNQLGLAKIILKRIITAHPDAPSSYNNQGIIALKEREMDSAVSAFSKSLSVDSGYFPALVNLSSLYMSYYDYEKALPLLKKAYAAVKRTKNAVRSQDYVKIANNYAVSLTWSGQVEEAGSVYRSLMTKNQTSAAVFINYAHFLIESLKSLSEAGEVLSQASLIARTNRDKIKIRNLRKKLKKGL